MRQVVDGGTMNGLLRFSRALVRQAFATCGLEIRRFPEPAANLLARQRLWQTLGIDLVLDVGANRGQFGHMLRREHLYQGRIHSFEPLSDAFAILQKAAAKDERWTVERTALGATDGNAILHVAANSYSSSLLPMTTTLLHSAPQASPIAEATVPVTRLDRRFGEISLGAHAVAMKLDTQGAEAAILQGASGCLDQIRLIEMEMSLITLYEGETLFMDAWRQLQEFGYELVHVEPEFYDPHTGRTLQVNGTFVLKGCLG